MLNSRSGKGNNKEKATLLLTQHELLSELKLLGHVNVTGSYSYDLMVEPDIDIEVYCTANREKAVHFAQNQIASGKWNGIMYYDWQQWRRDYFPEGYYVGLKQDFAGYRWKVDIWFLSENTIPRNTDSLIQQATEQQRTIILEAKIIRLKEN